METKENVENFELFFPIGHEIWLVYNSWKDFSLSGDQTSDNIFFCLFSFEMRNLIPRASFLFENGEMPHITCPIDEFEFLLKTFYIKFWRQL